MPSFSTITRALILALICVGATVTAAPTAEAEFHMLNAITEAENLGIDVNGPCPDDFTSFDAETGRYEFAAGSKASAWARARIALTSLPDDKSGSLEKRDSGVALGMWHGEWCSGSGWYIDDVIYGLAYVSSSPYISVGIGRRSLGPWEQLDFSKSPGCPTHGCGSPDLCGVYLYTAGTYTPPGCWNSGQYNCARLWLH